MAVFLEHVQIPFASCHFSLLVIKLFHSVSSCPYRKDGLLLIQIRNSWRVLYLMNQLAPNHGEAFNFKEFAQHQVESCAYFVLYHDIFFKYFIASATSGPFQNVFQGVAQAQPFLFQWHYRSHIAFEYWKRSAL